jgi:hypothetical protein
MKKLVAVLLFAVAVNANAVYKQPAVKVTYNVDGVVYSAVNFISTIGVVPFGQSKTIAVTILNNTTVAKNFGITITKLDGSVSSQFVADAGCNVPVAAYASCTTNVTFTPAAPSPDGTVQTETENFNINTSTLAGVFIKTFPYTIAGYSQ